MPTNAIQVKQGAKQKVAIDIDGTLALVHGLMIDSYNRKKGTNFSVENLTEWGFKSIGSTYAEMMAIYVNVWKNQWKDIPFSANPNQIMKLAEYYTVHLLTSRSASNKGMTGGTVDSLNAWRQMHGIGEDRIHMEICPPKHDKSEKFDYDIYIDDSPKLAESIKVNGAGARLLLVDTPYNRAGKEGKGVIRVADASEAILLLLSAAGSGKAKNRTNRG